MSKAQMVKEYIFSEVEAGKIKEGKLSFLKRLDVDCFSKLSLVWRT